MLLTGKKIRTISPERLMIDWRIDKDYFQFDRGQTIEHYKFYVFNNQMTETAQIHLSHYLDIPFYYAFSNLNSPVTWITKEAIKDETL